MRLLILFLLFLPNGYASQKHTPIYFAFDKYEQPIRKTKLDNIKKENTFFIQGYADPIGNKVYNKILSKKRAQSVKNHLISTYNIPDSNIKVRFYGEDLLGSYSNAQKRRVEITSGTLEEINLIMAEDKSTGSSIEYKPKVSLEKEHDFNEREERGKTKVESGKKDKPDFSDTKNARYDFQEDSNQKPSHRHFFGLGVYNNILLSTDRGSSAEAEWISNQNFYLEAQYQFKYKSLWLGLNGSYHKQDYEVELNPIFTWDEETPDLLQVSLVSDYEYKKWGFGLDLDYNQASFIYEDNFNIELRDIFILGISLRAKYKWYETKKWSSRLGLSLELPFLGSDEINPKGEPGLLAYVDLKRYRLFKGYALDARLYYGFKNYTNDQNDQEEETLGLLFSLKSQNWL